MSLRYFNQKPPIPGETVTDDMRGGPLIILGLVSFLVAIFFSYKHIGLLFLSQPTKGGLPIFLFSVIACLFFLLIILVVHMLALQFFFFWYKFKLSQDFLLQLCKTDLLLSQGSYVVIGSPPKPSEKQRRPQRAPYNTCCISKQKEFFY